MPVYDKSFPYKVYEATNAASTGAVVFLGKSSRADINEGNIRQQVADNNCFTTFLFASIEPKKNVKVSPATESDPYIFIDSKWFDFRPCGATADANQWPVNSLLSNVYHEENTDDLEVTFKCIVAFDTEESKDTVIVEGTPCDIKLSCWKYYSANLGEGEEIYLETIGNNGEENTLFAFRSLLAGERIRLCDDGKYITIHFEPDNWQFAPFPQCVLEKYSFCDYRYPNECSDLYRRAELLIENEPFPERIFDPR
jgi:hypothetical protein